MATVDPTSIPIGISGRHIHLSQEHLEILFGTGHKLTPTKDLSQPGQFACEETLNIVGAKNGLKNVRILGPVRKQTQVEVSRTDSFSLGVKPPIRDSGDLAGSSAVTLEGPAGTVTLDEGVIIAQRHLHLQTEEAASLNLEDKQVICIKVPGPRGLVFDNVLVRVHDNFALDMHVDTDEANGAAIEVGTVGQIVM